jgi:O-methyltransferase involved in polyketide biosynthesis
MSTDKHQAELGEIQETLYIPLLARVRETEHKHPLLRDPKAVEMAAAIDIDEARFGGNGGSIMVLRTAIYDHWVREFVAEHPSGTVVELGTGLNTRFERVDNGRVHWYDLDLPDTIDLRRRFFTDTDRRRMIVASVLDEDWMDTVAASPGPYLFVSEGVLVYLPPDDVLRTLRRIGERFPGSRLAIDMYPSHLRKRQAQMRMKRNIAPWQWWCDDPRELEPLGFRLLESAAYRRPPKAMRSTLPLRYRTIVALFDKLVGGMLRLGLFESTTAVR